MGQVVCIEKIQLFYIFETIHVSDWNYLDKIQLEIFHKQKKKQYHIHIEYLKSFYQKMQGLYKAQGLSMVSGDVDVTLLRELFNLKREQCVSAFFL